MAPALPADGRPLQIVARAGAAPAPRSIDINCAHSVAVTGTHPHTITRAQPMLGMSTHCAQNILKNRCSVPACRRRCSLATHIWLVAGSECPPKTMRTARDGWNGGRKNTHARICRSGTIIRRTPHRTAHFPSRTSGRGGGGGKRNVYRLNVYLYMYVYI